MDETYEAMQRHFDNLRQRYGKRIIILNLLKTSEKKHRETLLLAEVTKAIRFINRVVRKDRRLKAVHFDLSKHYKSGADGAFDQLCIFARKALELTDLFFCKAPSGVGAEGVLNETFFNNPIPSKDIESNSSENEALKADILMLQNGVLRTNCIDCLDRTNFAQYAHRLVALEHQLHTLGIKGPPIVDLDNPLAIKLMEAYQNMGDTLALQYGGSEAHIEMLCALRGDWNMVMKHRDIFTALLRYYNNAYLDIQKKNAINVWFLFDKFLGHFPPQLGRPALWELDSDQDNIDNEGLDLGPKEL